MNARLGLEKGEVRNIIAPVGEYKTIYCLSTIKKYVEAGYNVMYYSIENNTSHIQQRLLDSGIRLGKAKPFFRTLPSLNLTALRKQVEIDINKIANVKLVIIEDINLLISDYIGMKSFLEDITCMLKSADIACLFTTHAAKNYINGPINIEDIRHSAGAMHICDTVYGIKSVKTSDKISFWQWLFNIFRNKKNRVKPNTEKSIYLSVLKNRYGESNQTCKLDVDEKKLEFNFKQAE